MIQTDEDDGGLELSGHGEHGSDQLLSLADLEPQEYCSRTAAGTNSSSTNRFCALYLA